MIYSLATGVPITEIYSIIMILIEPMKETMTVSVDCLAVAVCSVAVVLVIYVYLELIKNSK